VAATRYSQPLEIPDDLGAQMATPVTGRVRLPNCIVWSGQGEFDPEDRRDRMYLNQVVMTEGAEDYLRRCIDVEHLVEMWNDMRIPPHVRERGRRRLRERDLIA
jgi:hypothetical protein